MSEPLRRAGRGRTADGMHIVWTVADGTRGRRWRSSTIEAGHLREGLLLELTSDGRFGRLELTTAAGLLTVHPDATGRRLHGNVAGPAGMRHLDLAWGPGHALLVTASPIVSAVAARRVADGGVGEGGWLGRAVLVGPDLDPRTVDARIEWLDAATWRLVADGRTEHIELDPRGFPRLEDAEEWALERVVGGER